MDEQFLETCAELAWWENYRELRLYQNLPVKRADFLRRAL